MYPGRLNELLATQEPRVFTMVSEKRGDPTFIPVLLTGGIGDAILSIVTLRRLKKEGFQLLVASEHKEAFEYFYKDIPIYPSPLPDFTWWLEIDSIARFRFGSGFSGFLILEHKKLFEQQRAWFQMNQGMEYLVEKHPRDKFALASWAKSQDLSALSFPLTTLGFTDIEWKVGERKPAEKYITIHDGYDANYQVSGRATKTWKWSSWNLLVRQFKLAYPCVEIIQVGSKTSRIIDGVTKCLVNQTSLTETFDILSKAQLHIDTDSGLVHAATAMGVPCVVMFGPTPASFYGHPQNLNVSRGTSCSGGCFHLTRDWMSKCPIGYDSPRCMDDISPTQVMSAVINILK